MAIWRLLFMQEIDSALILALVSAGNSSAARIAMMAITTSNSIKVNPARAVRRPAGAGGGGWRSVFTLIFGESWFPGGMFHDPESILIIGRGNVQPRQLFQWGGGGEKTSIFIF